MKMFNLKITQKELGYLRLLLDLLAIEEREEKDGDNLSNENHEKFPIIHSSQLIF
jgi:hypothetical protein